MDPKSLIRKTAYLAALTFVMFGCASDRPPAPTPVGIVDARPPMVVGGVGVSWLEIRALLAEGAGRGVLEEIVLDKQLATALERQGLNITESQIRTEQTRLEEALSIATGNADSGVLAEQTILARRGLGPVRLEQLLWRNAALHAIAAPGVEVTDADVRTEYDITHGPGYTARMIFVPNLTRASEAMASIEQGTTTHGLLGSFIQSATRFSTDASARIGGLTPAISDADPAYPTAVMQALRTMDEGELRGPIALERDFVLVYLERKLPGTGKAFAEVEPEMRRLANERKTKQAIDKLATDLLRSARVSTFDPSVRFAWESLPR